VKWKVGHRIIAKLSDLIQNVPSAPGTPGVPFFTSSDTYSPIDNWVLR